MSFIIGLLTVAMVFNCAVLILLILVQLPKKDAGAGLAFGGGAADALFGAGSGNALTKITKWSAGIFFAFALLVGYLEDQSRTKNSSAFENQVRQSQQQSAVPTPPPVSQPAVAPSTNSLLTLPLPATASSNAPAK
jgi:preprotein translocase subunit SecG